MEKLQYISQGKTPDEHLHNIEEVCKAGGKWIQLRLKDIDLATSVNTAIRCKEICDQFGAIMIVNDEVDVAKIARAHGVHLGLQDMNPKDARDMLGDNFIIGGTANNVNDCLKHIEAGVDYIGLGPFRYTTTKKNLSPVLGVKGYEQILDTFQNKNLKVPIVAIGGIVENDINALIQTGISGIAVSGLLTNTKNLEETIKNIKNALSSQEWIH
ncbi:thiamine phosphate synthase [Aquimarina gracilis]|uniref:Thiamine-phosphate synthase n=1 Tax=Aquimarina gracilis TaxID=874422 RepID=A0ABU6A0J2_9FLAO|nr:thiamine phosphate synthase [Aquimarina gracilis]MEB3347596.1 thiamine phosphate synthase [Aquimarina gracilis]